jgi:hypothetical protein
METPEDRKIKNKNYKRKIMVLWDAAQSVLLGRYRCGQTRLIRVANSSSRFLQKVGTLPNYEATHPRRRNSDAHPRSNLESLKTDKSKHYVHVTLYRKRTKVLNRFKHEINHLKLSGEYMNDLL